MQNTINNYIKTLYIDYIIICIEADLAICIHVAPSLFSLDSTSIIVLILVELGFLSDKKIYIMIKFYAREFCNNCITYVYPTL